MASLRVAGVPIAVGINGTVFSAANATASTVIGAWGDGRTEFDLLRDSRYQEAAEASRFVEGVTVAGGVTYNKAGDITAGTVASGPDSFQPAETGSLTTRALASGADVFNPNETGTTPVGTLLSGVSLYVPSGPSTYNKAGSITAGTLVSGPDSFQPVEAGSLTTRALVSGADVFTAAETGTTPVGTLLAGADATTHAETGTTPVGTFLSGASAKISSGVYVKTGSLVAQTLLTGVEVYVPFAVPSVKGHVAVAHLAGADAATGETPRDAVTVSAATDAAVAVSAAAGADTTAQALSGAAVAVAEPDP